MDRPGQDLLAGPALAGEQHRRTGGGHLACVVESRDEIRCPTDDRVEPESVVESGSQRRHLSLELLCLGLGSPQPLLVFGEPLMLDRKHEPSGNRVGDLHIARVVPVLTRRHEEEATTHLFSEQQWHTEK